jgi:uncharacterized protein (DUF488 family)
VERRVFTIGHSNHAIDSLIALFKLHGLTAVCDVRSQPYSRTNPQFNSGPLKKSLKEAGIAYVPLGKELGGRTADSDCYENGRVQYERIAQTQLFHDGLGRIGEGMKRFRLVLMCAEREPLDCHRTILVARYLVRIGIDIQHIHGDGRLESHESALQRLLQQLKLQNDMFRSEEEVVCEAYRRQEERIAFTPVVIGTNEGDASTSSVTG